MTTRADAISANQQLQGAGDAGFNIPMLSFGVGAPILLLVGGMLWFLWRRQTNQHKPVLRRISGNGQASRWVSSREIQSNLDTVEHASPIIYNTSGVSGASRGAGVLPMLGSSIQSMSSPQHAHMFNDSHTMMTNVPQQMLPMSSNNVANYPQNRSLQSLPMDSLNWSPVQQIEARESKNGQMLPFAAVASLSISPPQLPTPSTKEDPELGKRMH